MSCLLGTYSVPTQYLLSNYSVTTQSQYLDIYEINLIKRGYIVRICIANKQFFWYFFPPFERGRRIVLYSQCEQIFWLPHFYFILAMYSISLSIYFLLSIFAFGEVITPGLFVTLYDIKKYDVCRWFGIKKQKANMALNKYYLIICLCRFMKKMSEWICTEDRHWMT